jgi:diguanylate cyclase (GGDEF)-like protein
VVELTFIVAVANITIGFLLAVYLGYGPPGFAEALGTLRNYRPRFRFSIPKFSFKRKAPEPVLPVEPIVDESALEGLDLLFDVGTLGSLDIEPCDEPFDDDAAELLNPSTKELWDINEKYVEASVLRLNIAMYKSGVRATEIDTRLRACRGQNDRETVCDCLRLLREDCVSYLADQSAAAKKFRDRVGELGELGSLGDEIEMGNFEQAAQVETTLNNLEYMDFDANPEDGNYRLLEEIKNLGGVRHNLRDKQEAAFLAIARCENRIDKIEKQLLIDPVTKLLNRIGLESELHSWWKMGRQKTKSMSAMLFDVDRFGALNEKFGPAIAERIFYQVGQILKTEIGESDLLGRFGGQRFLVVAVGIGPRAALTSIERMRQTIEKTTFIHEEEKIKVTLSGAITEVKPDDAYINVLERLEKTIKLVKEAGPNHTFQFEKGNATPIASPNFGVDAVEIPI